MKTELKSLYGEKQYVKFSAYGFLKNLRFFEPFLVLFLLDKGQTYTDIGLLIGIREITVMLSEIPSGFIADALGRRRTLAASFGFYILSFVLFYFSMHFVGFAAAMLLFAVGDAFRTGVHKAMIFEYLKYHQLQQHKTDYYGRTRSWSQFGTAVSALLAGIFVVFSGEYQYIFLFSVLPYIADLLLVLSYPKWLDGEVGKQKYGLRKKFKDVWMAFQLSFRSWIMVKGLSNNAVHSAFYASAKDYIQPLLKTLALSLPIQFFENDAQQGAIVIGLTYFVIYLGTSLLSRRAGKFSKRFSTPSLPLNLTMIAGLTAGLISGFFYSLNEVAISIFFFVMILFNENLRKPIGIAYIADITDQKAMATMLSVESQLKALFAALFAPSIGLLADRFGLGRGLVIFCTALLLLSPLYLVRRIQASG